MAMLIRLCNVADPGRFDSGGLPDGIRRKEALNGQRRGNPTNRDFLRLCDRSAAELAGLIQRAIQLRAAFAATTPQRTLADRRVGFIWDGEGFRNRAAFELGVQLLAGHGVSIPGRLGEREPVEDLARYLDNWFDALVIRTPSFPTLSQFAQAATAPVINARTRHNHPCEILGDLAFVHAIRGHLQDLRVVFVGEASNLCHSWCEAAAVLPIHLTQVCPPGFGVRPAWLASLTPSPAGQVEQTHDLAAVRCADVVYTDCWPSRAGEEEDQHIRRLFGPLQITAEVLACAPAQALFLPCPPVTRGEEVSADAMQAAKCRVYEAKQWLLHAQNALLEQTLTEG
jgi:ornithine carbamoyltransferase